MARTISRSVSALREVVEFDAVFGADLHFREDCPECRDPEEFFIARDRKILFIQETCKKHRCPFIAAGDVFDYWKSSPTLEGWVLRNLPYPFITVPGQHDLQNHSLSSLRRTSLGVIEAAGRAEVLSSGLNGPLDGYKSVWEASPTGSKWPLWSVQGLGWGETPDQLQKIKGNAIRHVLLWHHLVCEKKQPWVGANAEPSQKLFSMFKGFDLIVTGDNHQQFQISNEDGSRWILNPGSMMRMAAPNQMDFEPAVYGWVAKINLIVRIPLPIIKGVIKTDHLKSETKEGRESRMNAYIKRVHRQIDARLSFSANLESYFKQNKTPADVKRFVWEAVGKGE